MFVDSHCHLNYFLEDDQLAKVMTHAEQAQVSHMLCVAVNMERFGEVIKIAEDYAQVTASVGKHPTEMAGVEPSVDDLIHYASHPKVVAIGESGLDYYYGADYKEIQQQRFTQHIQAAVKTQLPLIVHTRDAREDTIKLLTDVGQGHCPGVLHCFTESWQMAKAALDLGFYISFSGIVTFKNAKELQEVAKKVPLDRILIETDAPYLAPVPHRGKQNQPAFVSHVGQFVADLRQMAVEKVAELTANNFYQLFTKASAFRK
ncbi:hydrolase TatD [Piscirickettsia salmonis]|uniref:TatD family hydrolase n=1 Tax=Piscirickettsia salmonis TaxID=1238 RepID=UPI0002F45CE3|nr:TatD family hydrolase [Piscirickettsia salmonis]ALA26215.1 hydrolase, TatD family protein [Piscirickettsia salmonis]APS43654.1 hydrolase TatD [Piscirickettsia salmonis]APS47009.1 hydrolase TatD [Piscirickettsia salmonis]APS51543.1 hydrolase TatD [Piscirickettsia salmonis]APS54756.1 hydrolase TatD [Piscirickettsia salmonis]